MVPAVQCIRLFTERKLLHSHSKNYMVIRSVKPGVKLYGKANEFERI